MKKRSINHIGNFTTAAVNSSTRFINKAHCVFSGVPETSPLEAAHVWGLSEEWPLTAGESPESWRHTAPGEHGVWAQRLMGHHQRQIQREVSGRELQHLLCSELSVISFWALNSALSVSRQHKLEEALLFSGRFTDALQALNDWLYRAEPQLAEDVPVCGEKDLVNNLIDKHKVQHVSVYMCNTQCVQAAMGDLCISSDAQVFQRELGKRASCIRTLKRSVRDLTRSSTADAHWLQEQMEELEGRWEAVCKLSVSRQTRLEVALQQVPAHATDNHGTVIHKHLCIGWHWHLRYCSVVIVSWN